MRIPSSISLVGSTLKQFVSKGKIYLVVVIWLVSLLTFGVGCVHRNVHYLWIGFIASIFSGIFIQPLFDKNKRP
jgi:4-hydroxybenzoate polyprenyltransferase